MVSQVKLIYSLLRKIKGKKAGASQSLNSKQQLKSMEDSFSKHLSNTEANDEIDKN